MESGVACDSEAGNMRCRRESIEMFRSVVATICLSLTCLGTRATPQTPDPKQPHTQGTSTAQSKGRVDLYGDPLPPGVFARLGTIRLRQGSFSGGVVFARDGKSLYSADYPALIHVWDMADGKERRTLHLGEPVGFQSVLAVSQDQSLAVYAAEKGAYLCDLRSGKTLRRILFQDDFSGVDVALSPDGTVLAVGGGPAGEGPSCLLLWSVATGRLLRRFTGPLIAGELLGFTPDGQRLLCMGSDRAAGIWDISSGTCLRRISLSQGSIESGSCALSADGRTLAVWCRHEGIRWPGAPSIDVWDISTSKRTRRIPMLDLGPQVITFAPDGKRLASAGGEAIHIWEVETGQECLRIPTGPRMVQYLAISRDGRLLAGPGRLAIHLWDLATGRPVLQREAHDDRVSVVRFAPNGKTILTSSPRSIRSWRRDDGSPLWCVKGLREPVWSIRLSPDGTMVLAEDKNAIVARDTSSGKVSRRFIFYPELAAAGDIAESRDGRTLYASTLNPMHDLGPNGRSYGTTAWDVPSGARLWQRMDTRDHSIEWFSPDGLLGFTHGGSVCDTLTGRIVCPLWGADEEHSWFVGFSKDGRLALTQSSSRSNGRSVDTVHLWEIASGKEIWSAASWSHTHELFPGNRFLATAAGKALAIRDLLTDKMVFERPIRRSAQCLALSPDRQCLAVAIEGESSVLLWDVSAEQWEHAPERRTVTSADVERLWQDLASDDARRAHAAIWTLEDAADASVAMLSRRLAPDRGIDESRFRQLVSDLDSAQASTRAAASAELERMMPAALPAIRHALSDDLGKEARGRLQELANQPLGPIRDAKTLRDIRAIQVLERIATPAAKTILNAMRSGAAESPVTREARSALERLGQRVEH